MSQLSTISITEIEMNQGEKDSIQDSFPIGTVM